MQYNYSNPSHLRGGGGHHHHGGFLPIGGGMYGSQFARPIMSMPFMGSRPYYGGTGFGGMGIICFAGTSTVTTSSGKVKKMSEVQIGDSIQTINGKTGEVCNETVYAWLHRDEKLTAVFEEVEIEPFENGGSSGNNNNSSSSRSTLIISSDHLIYNATTGSIVPVHELKVGEYVYVTDRNGKGEVGGVEAKRITRKSLVTSKGVYAPVTRSGNIIVNNIVCSCYAKVDFIKSHELIHKVMLPLRIKAKLASTVGLKREVQEGFNSYVKLLISLVVK